MKEMDWVMWRVQNELVCVGVWCVVCVWCVWCVVCVWCVWCVVWVCGSSSSNVVVVIVVVVVVVVVAVVVVVVVVAVESAVVVAEQTCRVLSDTVCLCVAWTVYIRPLYLYWICCPEYQKMSQLPVDGRLRDTLHCSKFIVSYCIPMWLLIGQELIRYFIKKRTRYSDYVTSWKVHGSYPGRSKIVFSPTNLPDRLRAPHNFVFNGYQSTFLEVKWLGSELDHSHPPSAEVKKVWRYTPALPICLHGVD